MTDRHVTNEPTPFAMVPEALLFDPEMSDKACRLYGVLRRHGDDPANCYPSKRRLADLMGCAPASLNRPLNELEGSGWIERVPRVDDRGQTSNGYHVRLAPRTSSAPPSLENDGGPRAEAMGPIAQERAEREHVNDSQEREEVPAAAPLELVARPEVYDLFPTFWSRYPRKIAKPEAEKAWKSAVKGGGPTIMQTILDGLDVWVAFWKASRTEPQYVPHPSTWLRQARWNDQPTTGRAATGPRAPVASDRAATPGRVVDL